MAAARQQHRVGPGVKLQVAEHAAHRRADLAQAFGVGLGLRIDGGERGIAGPGQPRQAQRVAQRFLAQPGVDQQQRQLAARVSPSETACTQTQAASASLAGRS